MKKVFLLFISVTLFLSFGIIKETSATFSPGYTRDSLTGLSYDSLLTLSGATKVTAVQSGTADDGSIFINLPFTFKYNGANFTRVTVSTNGWVAMDSTTATNFSPNLFTTAAAPFNVIAGWFRDNNLNTANQGMWVHQQRIVGSDTIYVIEYRNFSGASGGGTSATLQFNMQVWLYKTSNKIEMRYGPILGTITQSAALGIKDDGAGAVPHYYNALTNNSTSTTLSTAWPAAGNGYRYNPVVPLANDVGTTVILNPVNGGGAGNQAPVATIRNFGSANQSGFNVTCTISPGGYSFTQVAPLLVSGASANINFANVTLAPNTPYTVTVYTSLVGDQNLLNDTQRVTVSLIIANYGNDSGYFYANNLATDQPSFPRWGWKDTSGSKNLILNGVVQPGNTIVGSLDDGYFKLNIKNILLAANQDTTNKVLKLNGICYDSIFPGTNGIIGLTEQFGTYNINDFNIDGAQVAKNAILAFWHDANFGAPLTGGSNRLSYKVKQNQLLITYDRAKSFAPTTDWVSYQVVIEIAEGCAAPNSNWRVTFADTTNQNTSSSFYNNYIAQTTATPPAVTIFRNYVMGWTGSGLPNVYSGYVSSGNPFPATPVTQVSLKRPVFNATGNGLAVEFGPNQNILNMHNVVFLDLMLSLEGLQTNGRVRDTVEVTIRDGNSAPYKVMQRTKVYLDSAHNGSFAFGRKVIEATVIKDQYPLLLEIRHRNSIKSWSNIFVANNTAIAYNFTTGLSQIYNSNGVLVNGAASYFGGDVNGDQVVDISDVGLIDNDAANFVSGDYVITDLNWDGVVDLIDAALADNNAFNFVAEAPYPGAVSAYADLPSFNYNYKAPTEIISLPDTYAQPKIDLNAIQNIDIKKED